MVKNIIYWLVLCGAVLLAVQRSTRLPPKFDAEVIVQNGGKYITLTDGRYNLFFSKSLNLLDYWNILNSDHQMEGRYLPFMESQ
jgi:hypothetical protein